MPVDLIVLLLLVFLMSAVGTGLMRHYALRRRVLDIPNSRSSHQRAVPLGGGVALAIAVVAGMSAAYALGRADGRLALAIGAGGAVLAMVGWIDDRRTVPAHYRLAVQASLALGSVLLLGGMPTITLGSNVLRLGWLALPLAVLAIVWISNVYNFMDGIDGIAGGQATAAGVLGGGLVWWLGSPEIAIAPLVLGSAGLGFLLWNWQPARIFMGDAGSVTLGYSFAVTAVASENAGALPWLAWIMIFGGFLFDTTATMLRRIIRREDWTASHRLHAYQRLVQSGLSHAQVSVGAILLTCAMAGVALLVVTGYVSWLFGATAALVVLVTIYYGAERRLPMAHNSRSDADSNAFPTDDERLQANARTADA